MGSAKPPKREESIPLPNAINIGAAAVPPTEAGPSASAVAIEGAEEDDCLARSDVLSREEVLRRRSRRVRQLVKCYRQQYWALVEEVRVKHRDFYWEFGLSPFEEDEEERAASDEDGGEKRTAGAMIEAGVGLGFGEGEANGGKKEERKRCGYNACKAKAMPLTRYCHTHILNDRNQTLYKACSHVTKSCGQGAPITCGKPVLRAAVPSLCPTHFDKARKNFLQAFRKAGLSVSSTNKIPKFSTFIAEYVRQIQGKTSGMITMLASQLLLEHIVSKMSSSWTQDNFLLWIHQLPKKMHVARLLLKELYKGLYKVARNQLYNYNSPTYQLCKTLYHEIHGITA